MPSSTYGEENIVCERWVVYKKPVVKATLFYCVGLFYSDWPRMTDYYANTFQMKSFVCWKQVDFVLSQTFKKYRLKLIRNIS